jgi:phosphonate transport system ATP-binding protein
VTLVLDHLTVHYPATAAAALVIDHLRIAPGERVALLGRSGAGKSTLLRALYHQAPEPVACARIAQSYDLVPQLSVFNNIDAGRLDRRSQWRNLRNLLHPHPADRRVVEGLAAELGLSGLLARRVGELSGGQQQRVAVARALYSGAPTLFADEPVSALDPQQGAVVLGLLAKRCATLVVAMHAVDAALTVCDRLIGLDAGRVVLDVATAQADRAALMRLFDQ